MLSETYVPSLGTDYTEKKLNEWLDKRLIFLNKIKDYTNEELQKEYETIYNGLDDKQKKQAENIMLNNGDFSLPIDEELVFVRLLNFAKRVKDGGIS